MIKTAPLLFPFIKTKIFFDRQLGYIFLDNIRKFKRVTSKKNFVLPQVFMIIPSCLCCTIKANHTIRGFARMV